MEKVYKIMIDPGHGGSDSGAINKSVKEKDINLTVALRLKKRLLERGCFLVMMSRESDRYVSIAERAKMANDWGADITISIHHNAGGGDGWEVIHSIYYGVGVKLANAIGKEFSELGQNMHWKGVYCKESEKNPGKDYYGIIRQTKMPCVISEYAFLDSTDFEAIDTIEEQYGEAEALYKAICAFYKISPVKPHWAEQYYNFFNTIGIQVHEKRFNDSMTRGEHLALMYRFYEYLVKTGVLSGNLKQS